MTRVARTAAPIPPQRWVAPDWMDAPLAGSAGDGASRPALRVLTWNVWFGDYKFPERARALLAELGRRQPDVVLLQEVTIPLLRIITREPWVRDRYQLSDADGVTIDAYGVLMLSRSPFRKLELLELPSEMGRTLLAGELESGLEIATVHLESTAMCTPARVRQLGIIQEHLRGANRDVLLAGDMNFAPHDRDEQNALESEWIDVWPSLHDPEAPGFTIDTAINTMRLELKSKPRQSRIDRVFVRSAKWKASAIELVGTSAIDPGDPLPAFVSDHFGLEATLVPR